MIQNERPKLDGPVTLTWIGGKEDNFLLEDNLLVIGEHGVKKVTTETVDLIPITNRLKELIKFTNNGIVPINFSVMRG